VFFPSQGAKYFEPWFARVLNGLLFALSEEYQNVRYVAYRAAQTITRSFGATHTALLLPPLEEGLFETDYRIRHASVLTWFSQLSLLVVVDFAADESADFAATGNLRNADNTLAHQVMLLALVIEQILKANRMNTNNVDLMSCEVMPPERRAYILSSLYIVRSDESPQVLYEFSLSFRKCCSNSWYMSVQVREFRLI